MREESERIRPAAADTPAVAIIRARRAGNVIFTVTRNPGLRMEELMLMHGLQPRTSALLPVTSRDVAECITVLLWKDLAYGVEIMPPGEARAHADAFVAAHASGAAHCFANIDYARLHREGSYESDSLTDATFSASVMVLHPDHAVSLTIEDED